MMNFKLNPTLKDRALTKVAVALWNQDNFKILCSRECYSSNDLELAEAKVREKAAELLLPSALSKELLHIISIIRLELRTWIIYHQRFGNYFGADSPAASKFELHFTPYGTIDRKRTAEAIVENENINTLTRYKHACNYCLESSVRNLWGKLDRSDKAAIVCSMPKERRREFPACKGQLLMFWTNVMISETSNCCTWANGPNDTYPYRHPFEGAAFAGNDIALKYFIHKLSPEEKENCLLKAASCVAARANLECSKLKIRFWEYNAKVLFFLLSSMNEVQQNVIFKEHAHQVLLCLLQWPWQEFFISTAEHVMEYLSPVNFQFLLYELINPEFVIVYRYFNYQNIFQKLWERSPSTHKKYLLDGPICKIFKFSLKAGQEQNILLIMKDATPEQMKKILCSCESLCCNLIIEEKVDFLKLFLLQCIAPNNESKIAELNARLVPFSSRVMAGNLIEKCKLLQFVLDFLSSMVKRKLPEEHDIPLKKQCVEDEKNEY